jgi:hypothetical protein
MKENNQQPEKENKAEIESAEYWKLDKATQDLYKQVTLQREPYGWVERFRFGGPGMDELKTVYRLKTAKFDSLLTKWKKEDAENKAPLSNNSKVGEGVESKTAMQILAERQCVNLEYNHFLLHAVTTNKIIVCMEEYASQQKNHALSVIQKEIAELQKFTKEIGISESLLKCIYDQISILNKVLKLIQP